MKNMKKLNPISQSTLIEDEYREFLRSEFHLSDEALRETFENQLEEEELFKGPYLSMNLPFKRGKNLLELNEEGVICDKFLELSDIKAERPLYYHQEVALRKICAGRSAIITTGTGSGKTESFLYPILNTILKDVEAGKKGKGIKALFLYPMNALINDQIDRVRELLKNTPQITFGFYTSDTKWSQAVAKTKYKEQHNCEPPVNEIISREAMQENPPDLLFTNYSMLEYLLIRPNDMRLVSPDFLKNWKFVVLDEAHTYHGALGIELSYLLRRVTGLAKEKPQFLLTSATLGSKGKSEEAILDFAHSLTSADFELEDIIFAERIYPVDSDVKYEINAEDYSRLVKYYENIDEVKKIATKYLPEYNFSGMDVANILFYLLKGDKTVYQIYEILKDGVKPYKEVQRQLKEDKSHNLSDEDLTALIVLLNRAQLNGLRLFDLKFHSFIRPISGIYMTLGNDKQIKLTQTNVINGRKAFEIGHCRYCNASYIIGKTIQDEEDPIERLVQNNEIDIYDNYGNRSFSEVEYYLIDKPHQNEEDAEIDLEDTDTKSDYIEYTLCTKCGCIFNGNDKNAAKCSCGSEYAQTIYKVKSEEKNLRNNVYRCISCGRHNANGIVKTLHLGKDEGTAIVAQLLYQSMGNPEFDLNKFTVKRHSGGGLLGRINHSEPELNMPIQNRKQLLMFSDSRQQASFAATFLARNHEKMLRKRLLWEVISKTPREKRTISYVIDQVKRAIANGELFPRGRDCEEEATLSLLVELLKVDGVFSSEGLGLYYFELDFSEYFDWEFIASQLQELYQVDFTAREARDLFNVVFDCFKLYGAVKYKGQHNVSEDRAKEVLQYRYVDYYMKLIKGKNEINGDRTKSFLPVTNFGNKSFDFVRKVFSCSKNEAEQIMTALWETILKMPKEEKPIFADELYGGYKIPIDRYAIKSALDLDVHFYQCDKCGLITPYNVKCCCINSGCTGKLHIIDPDELFEGNYYRKEYLDKYIEPMLTAEHTAQIERDEARKIQKNFKEKKLNVLSCSTTFEMGVDIGDLETVFLRNIPPRPDNYVQRAGRAGRGFDSSAYVLTYCTEQSHDYTYFLEPEKMIEGVIQPPHFEILNDKILLRHLMAASFGFFFKASAENEKLNKLQAFLDADGINKFKVYMKNHPETLRVYLEESVIPKALRDKYKNYKWFDGDEAFKTYYGEQIIDAFDDLISNTLKEYRDKLVELRQKLDAIPPEELIKKGPEVDCMTTEIKLLNKALTSILDTSMIDTLSINGVIPKYGFPVDVVDLEIIERRTLDRSDKNNKLNLSRDLGIAISEYAPDSEIIAAGTKYVSKYVKLPSRNKAFEHIRFYECNSCKKVNIIPTNSNSNDLGYCKYCGEAQPLDMKVQNYIEPRLGFIGEASKNTRRLKPVKSFLGEVTYLGGGEDESLIEWGSKFSLRTSKNDELLVLNRSTFRVCEECGYSEIVKGYVSGSKLSHKTSWGQDCKNTALVPLRLGHKFKTDVINLDVSSLVDSEGINFEWEALLSFMYAFLEGMSEALQIERNDLNGLVQPVGHERFDVLLYDNVPGGAGHVKRLKSKDNFVECLRWAWKKVNQGCCDDDSSCYACLRNYGNQRYHDVLSRNKAKEVVNCMMKLNT